MNQPQHGFSNWLAASLSSCGVCTKETQVLLLVDKRLETWLTDWRMPYLPIEASEEKKTLKTVETIYAFLHAQTATRHSVLVCVGGGVITDIGGFAAATFKRGMRCVYVPTTLLSMVDASIGGKTGVNLGGVKNEVGVFHTPEAVLIYPDALRTLSLKERLSGFAEMLKHALIADRDEWNVLLRLIDGDALDTLNEDFFEHVCRSCRIKETFCAADPLDIHQRHALNFGHTVGHAIETISIRSTKHLPHGFAVMQGMVAALYMSVVLHDCPRRVLQQAAHTMTEHYGRAVCPCKSRDELLMLMRADKKNTAADGIRFVLLKDIGQPLVGQAVDDTLINESLEYLFSL